MASKSFQFTLTTPQGKLLDVAASNVVFPAHDGSMGILPGRAPMVVKLGTGPLRVDVADTARGEGGSRTFLVEEGFAQMVGTKFTVLTSRATPAESMTESEAQAEFNEAEARRPANPADAARTAKDKARAQAKLRMVRSGRGGI